MLRCYCLAWSIEVCKQECFWNLFLPGFVSRLPAGSSIKEQCLLTGLEWGSIHDLFVLLICFFAREECNSVGNLAPTINFSDEMLLSGFFWTPSLSAPERASNEWMFSERGDPRDLLACQASKLSTVSHSQWCFRAARKSEPSICHLQSTTEVPHPRIMFQKQFERDAGVTS